MTEATENIMLELLKRFQTTLERIESKQEELVRRMSGIENSMVSLKRDAHHGDETNVHLQMSIDRLSTRLDRVEHRLELA
jgi:hypothetical protein